MALTSYIKKILTALNAAYALVDTALTIVDHDPLLATWLSSDDLRQRSLLDLFPELIGQEDYIASLPQDDSNRLELEHINRVDDQGGIRYFTLIVLGLQLERVPYYLAILANVTDEGHYLQELMQRRNELQMAHRRMTDLSYKLDYLLRHYLAPEVADAFLKDEMDLQLGGQLQDVSVMFADIRDFTTLSEQLPPDQVVQQLNTYLQIAGEPITAQDGVISQFQGDNMLVIFNMFGQQPDHAERAVEAGCGLLRAVANFRDNPPDATVLPLHFGVGINSGPVLIGNIGAQRRFSYTAIGDTVNLAARITGAAPADELWISHDTYQHLPSTVSTTPLPAMTFKGKAQATRLYQVLSA